MKTISSTPAEDAMLRLWVWLSVHRKTRAVLAVMILCTVSQLINTTAAMADDDSAPKTTLGTYWLPLGDVTDSHGVPVDQYTELPLDYGQSVYVTRQIRGVLMRIAWMGYTLVTYAVLALCDFILSLEWLDWVLAPLTLLANSLQGVLDRTGIIGLGIAIAALVIAWGAIRGKMGAALAEAALVAVVVGLVASPMGNPSSVVKDWITVSADYGTEASQATVTGTEEGAKASSNPVSGQIVDLTVRRPALMLSFGSDLEGSDCATTWDDKAKDHADAEKKRKAILKCDKELKGANETDNFAVFAFFFMFCVSTAGVLALVSVFLFFLLKDVLLAGLGAINTVLRAHLAVFPGGGRQAFLNAFLQMVVNVVMVGVYVFLLSVYLWLLGKFTQALGAAVMMIANLMLGLMLLALAVTFWWFKRQGKSVGRRLAEALGTSPLNKAPKMKPSVLSRAGEKTTDLGKKAGSKYLQQRAKKKAMTRGLTALAAMGVGAATGGAGTAAVHGVSRGMAAASAARSASRARTAPTPGPSRPDTGAAPRTHSYQDRPAISAQPAAEESPQPETTEAAAPTQGWRNEDGSIPMGSPRHTGGEVATTTRSEEETDTPPREQSSTTQDAGTTQRSGTPSVPARTGSSSTAVTPTGASQTQGNTATPQAGTPQESGPAPHRTPRQRSTMPAGQYGTVRVNRNGTTNNVVTGEVVDTVPPHTKVVRAWDMSDTDGSSQRPQGRKLATQTGVYQMHHRKSAAERGEI